MKFGRSALSDAITHKLRELSAYLDGLRILNDDRLQPLCLSLLDIHSLHIAVQLLLCTLLVISLSADSHSETEWDALDAGFPDFLVELWIKADVGCALEAG